MNYHQEPVLDWAHYQVGSPPKKLGTKPVPNEGLISGFPRVETPCGKDMPGGLPAWRALADTAWGAAVAQGKAFAKDCKCICKNITVVIVCPDGPLRDDPVTAKYCDPKKPTMLVIPCQKNSKCC